MAPGPAPDVRPDEGSEREVGNRERLDHIGGGLPSHGEFTGVDDGMCREAPVADPDTAERISRFADHVRELLAPWSSQRLTTDLTFDVTAVNEAMASVPREWPREDLREALDRGTTREVVREIGSFERGLSPLLVELLALGPADWLRHRYTLELSRGVTGGWVAEGTVVPGTLTYHNEVGMRWSVSGYVILAGAAFELTADATGIHTPLLPSIGTTEAEVRESRPTLSYFRPEDFGSAVVYAAETSAEASAAMVHTGLSASGMSLEHDGRRIDFFDEGRDAPELETGVEVELGGDPPSLAPEASVGLGASAGTVLGEGGATGDPVGVTELGTHDHQVPDPEILATATVYFGTGESELDAEDDRQLTSLVRRIEEVGRAFPHALFVGEIVGYATRRWRSAPSEEVSVERNEGLAWTRAAEVYGDLLGRLGDPNLDLGMDVRGSPIEMGAGELVGDGPDADPDVGRRVDVQIRWHPCDPMYR